MFSMLIHSSKILKDMQPGRVFYATVVFSVLLMLSIFTAFNPNTAQSWAIEWAKILVIALIAMLVITKMWQVQLMVIMLAATIGYVGYTINIMYVFDDYRLDVLHYGFGGLDNNGAGLMLAIGIPFAYYFAFVRHAKMPGFDWIQPWMQKAAGIVAGLFLVHAVMMTYSRGAMLAALCGLGWLWLHHRPKWQMGILLVAGLLAINVLAGSEIRDRFISTTDFHEDGSAQSRFDSWSAAWHVTWENPLLGKGIRNSNWYIKNYGGDYIGRTVHNQYLQIAADSGVPAAVTYIALVVFAILNLRWARRKCLRVSRDADDEAHELDPSDKAYQEKIERRDEYEDHGRLWLAVEASLVTFIIGAMFLSLEVFELPWVMIILGAVAPHAMHQLMTDNEPETDPLAKLLKNKKAQESHALGLRLVTGLQPASSRNPSQ